VLPVPGTAGGAVGCAAEGGAGTGAAGPVDASRPPAVGDPGGGPSPTTRVAPPDEPAAGAPASTCRCRTSKSRPRAPIRVPSAVNSPERRETSAGSIEPVMALMVDRPAGPDMSRNTRAGAGHLPGESAAQREAAGSEVTRYTASITEERAGMRSTSGSGSPTQCRPRGESVVGSST